MKKNTLIIIIFFILIAGIILPQELNNLDEIWNYNFARCIADGLQPYRDFNMVQTPLLPIICGIILKITFNELIIMRILAILFLAIILFTTYKIFERLKVNTYIINIFMIGIYLLLYKYFCIDYNYAVLLITLITIYIELKYEVFEVNLKKDFCLGILVGTSILFKQTTGLALTLIFILYKLLLVSKKDEFKIVLKAITNRTIGSLVPISVFAIYLSINNIWEDFLDYTIYSIKTFDNKISYLNLINGNYGIIIQILSISIPFTILIMYYLSVLKKHTRKEQKNIFILFSYSVSSLVVAYPISDSIHFLIGAMPCLIGLCYLMYVFTNKILEKTKKSNQAKKEIKYFMKSFGFLTTCIILIFSICNLIKYISIANKYINLKHFKYIPSTSENVNEICNYIIDKNNEGKKVYILDATAAIYMIPLDKYNKDYDLFLKGNIGSKGEDGLIKKLNNEQDGTEVLVLNSNYKKNWQTPTKVINYIVNNWKKNDCILYFDCYCKKMED